ncbi:MAG: radical SAM protein [Lachnospiraceae bacterium]|nr:radical SAM protein [Lachnospiraceae bacterium]
MEKRLEQIHLQITRNCNLRCYFCGQWGKKGFFSDASGEEMTLENWENVIFDIIEYRSKTGISPFIMLWGGEPLVSPHFPAIAELLHEHKFKVGMVTNGVLLDRHSRLVNEAVQRIFVSLDGPPELHNAIRGQGVFEKVASNMALLTKPEITVMSVVTEELIDQLPEFLEQLNRMNIHELYLQDMIGLTTEEIQRYKAMMLEEFDIRANYIDAWENNERLQFHDEVDSLLSQIDRGNYHFSIVQKKHGGGGNLHCLSPFRHAHVTWNGNVIYCTDFYDFKAGNVKVESLENIFMNEMSEKYRAMVMAAKCVACRHCSWKDNQQYL